MIKISKLFTGTSYFSHQTIDMLAHNLVFKKGLTQEALDATGFMTVFKQALPSNQQVIFSEMAPEEQEVILEMFKNFCDDAFYDFKYADFEFDDEDPDPELRGFTK